MDKRSRRKFSPEFMAKVALEALQEREGLETLSKKYALHPNQITLWKKQFKEEASKVFETEAQSSTIKEKEALISELYRQIGELKIDNDWLKKSFNDTNERASFNGSVR